MILLRKKEPEQGTQRALPGTSGRYEVPNGTVTVIGIVYILLNILGISLGNVLTSFGNQLATKPQREMETANFRLKEQNFQLQLLQRVLEVQNPAGRKVSVELLINAGLLNDNDGKFTRYVQDHNVPKWLARNLESLSSYQSAAGSGYNTYATSPPNAGIPSVQPSNPPAGNTGITFNSATQGTSGSTTR